VSMSLITAGLPNSGRTAHFQIRYDEASSLDGRASATELVQMCEDDYDLMSRWFRGVELSVDPVEVGISTSVPREDAAQSESVTVLPGPHPSAARLHYLFVAEISKLLMRAQDRGWLDPQGAGHGLSLARFLGAQALAGNALGAPPLDLQPANAWMASPREDFVNQPGDGEVPDGCRVLFLYYLMMQLKFGVDQIVGAAAADLASVYRNLTGKIDDPFPHFKELLDGRYPGARTIPDHPDNPWPIGHLADDLIDKDEVPPIDWGYGGRFFRP
jgi:hypothetical protein